MQLLEQFPQHGFMIQIRGLLSNIFPFITNILIKSHNHDIRILFPSLSYKVLPACLALPIIRIAWIVYSPLALSIPHWRVLETPSFSLWNTRTRLSFLAYSSQISPEWSGLPSSIKGSRNQEMSALIDYPRNDIDSSLPYIQEQSLIQQVAYP